MSRKLYPVTFYPSGGKRKTTADGMTGTSDPSVVPQGQRPAQPPAAATPQRGQVPQRGQTAKGSYPSTATGGRPTSGRGAKPDVSTAAETAVPKQPRRVCARKRKESGNHFRRRRVRRRKFFSARKRASVSECAAASRSLFKREPNEAALV